jgi:hypothetical protein
VVLQLELQIGAIRYPEEVKNLIIEAIVGRLSADIDHRGTVQLPIEDREHQSTMLLVEGTHGVVEQDTLRRMQQQPGESKTLLLVKGKALIPPFISIQRRHQVIKRNALKGCSNINIIELSGCVGVCYRVSQRTERQIGPLWHEHGCRSGRYVDCTTAPWPKAGQGAEECAFP